MSGEPQAAARLELSYSPTAGDFREALAARSKVSVSARRLRLLTVVGIAFAIVAGGASWWKDGRVEAPLVVMLVGFLLIRSGVPRLQARQFHRLSVARGAYRADVDDSGVSISTEQTSSTLTWQAAPRYVETPRLFVLMSGDKNASCLTLLPKRGASGPADVDRLRTVLDQHLPAGVRPSGVSRAGGPLRSPEAP